jgi:hypothetical protein
MHYISLLYNHALCSDRSVTPSVPFQLLLYLQIQKKTIYYLISPIYLSAINTEGYYCQNNNKYCTEL